MYELLATCFCATSICCVQLQTCSQGITKLCTHLTHVTRSSLSIVTFSSMHSNCIAHNAIKFNYSYYHATFIQAIGQPQTWHHFVFLCPPSSQSPMPLHKRCPMSFFMCTVTLRPPTPALHCTTFLLILSIWREPVFSVIIDVPLPYNMFCTTVNCAFSLHNPPPQMK